MTKIAPVLSTTINLQRGLLSNLLCKAQNFFDKIPIDRSHSSNGNNDHDE